MEVFIGMKVSIPPSTILDNLESYYFLTDGKGNFLVNGNGDYLIIDKNTQEA